MKQHLIKMLSYGIAGTTLIMALASPLLAETITIGKGRGIVWEGMPFNKTVSGALETAILTFPNGLLSISNRKYQCLAQGDLSYIGGYALYTFRVANGVGLVPRATGNATFTYYDGKAGTLNGTIGLPDTKGSSSSDAVVRPGGGYAWCLPPSMTENNMFYKHDGPRTATISGTWVLVADGNQTTQEIVLPSMYFGSFSALGGGGDKAESILPANISLRISTLECSVSTPTTINFGTVGRNLQAGSELAVKTEPLVTTCGQASNFINANINLQFRALSGTYGGAPSRLALNQGGGYITGEIDNGVTGSGACNATTGVKFDNTRMKVGQISASESSKTLTNQVTWRLCSGGASLPSGAVTASAEMLVTFN